jgi:hypothetical protein
MSSSNHPPSPQSNDPGQAVADLTNDIHNLTGKVDSFALLFTLAWRQNPDRQRQSSTTTSP